MVWVEISVGGGGASGVVLVSAWRKFDGEKSGRKRDDAGLLPFAVAEK